MVRIRIRVTVSKSSATHAAAKVRGEEQKEGDSEHWRTGEGTLPILPMERAHGATERGNHEAQLRPSPLAH